jgi:hypothetical protein
LCAIEKEHAFLRPPSASAGRGRTDDLHATAQAIGMTIKPRRFADLISYHNDERGCAVIADKVEMA